MSGLFTFLFSGFIGFGVGIYGSMKQWSLLRTVITASTISVFLNLLVQLAYADDISKAQANLRSTTVHIMVGTGSVVEGASGKKYILTNYHVCNAAKWKGTLTASYQEGPSITGKIVKEDPGSDLCAASVDKKLKGLKLATHRLLPFTHVQTRGYPTHILTESDGNVVTDISWDYEYDIAEVGECPIGSVKDRGPTGNLEGCKIRFKSTLTTLYSRPGSSGSPVVNDDGDLVGVISSWHHEHNYEAGMVTFNQVKEFLGDL